MVSFFGSEAKRLFFLVPLKISFNNDNTSIIDDINKHSFIEHFLDSTIYDEVMLALMSPFHILKFSTLFIVELLIFYLLFSFLIDIESVSFYHWDVSCRTDVIGTWVSLSITAFIGSCDLKKPQKREWLKNSSTHFL